MNNKECLLMAIQATLNVPYKWGGYNPVDGYDCSGFVQDMMSTVGLDPPGDQTSNMLMDYYSKNGTEIGVPEFGALIFFGRSKERATHVSIALNERSMVEAAGGGSKTKTLEDAKKHNAFVRITNINRRKDILKIIKLNISWELSK